MCWEQHVVVIILLLHAEKKLSLVTLLLNILRSDNRKIVLPFLVTWTKLAFWTKSDKERHNNIRIVFTSETLQGFDKYIFTRIYKCIHPKIPLQGFVNRRTGCQFTDWVKMIHHKWEAKTVTICEIKLRFSAKNSGLNENLAIFIYSSEVFFNVGFD